MVGCWRSQFKKQKAARAGDGEGSRRRRGQTRQEEGKRRQEAGKQHKKETAAQGDIRRGQEKAAGGGSRTSRGGQRLVWQGRREQEGAVQAEGSTYVGGETAQRGWDGLMWLAVAV